MIVIINSYVLLLKLAFKVKYNLKLTKSCYITQIYPLTTRWRLCMRADSKEGWEVFQNPSSKTSGQTEWKVIWGIFQKHNELFIQYGR